MFTVLALLVLAPLMMWQERSQRFRMLDPVEQNLQRASHGFALMAFVPIAVFGMYGASGVFGFFPRLVANPAEEWPGAVFFGGLFVYGFARFLAGVRRSAGVRDGLLALRAFVKLAVGIAAFVFLWGAGNVAEGWAAFLWMLLMAAAAWCILTGTVRFLLTIGIRRRQKAPPLHPSPRGRARDASQSEAKAAMRGSGGRKIPLDDRTF